MSARPFNTMLRECRNASGLTLADMAAVLGVSARLLHSWETGKSEPSKLERLGICELLGMGGSTRTTGTSKTVLLGVRKSLMDALAEIDRLQS